MLSLLFLGEMKALEKCKALEANFGIEMYQEISEEVSNMCDLSADVWEKGVAQGYSKGMAQGTNNILSLFSNLYAQGRSSDVERATKDREYLNKLFMEFKL